MAIIDNPKKKATTVAIFTKEQWAARLVQLYPNSWTSDAAKVAGGILFAFFESAGTQLNFIQNGLDYCLAATRIATARGDALDAIAVDYFGTVRSFEATVIRQSGELDSSFRARIFANLLQSGGTRPDIIRVVQLLTGVAPRITEPWNVLDTCACDSTSFLDIDTPPNPCRVGDLNFGFQGMVESILPSYGGQGNNPVYCADDGFSCDRSFIIDPQPTWFIGERELDIAINRVRMGETIVWRKYGGSLVVNYARGNTAVFLGGELSLSPHLSPPCSQALVVLACASWNASVTENTVSKGDFGLYFSTPATAGAFVDWIAAPATLAGYGLLPLTPGSTGASLAIQDPSTALIVTPSWNTDVWLSSLTVGVSETFEWSTPSPPGGYLNYGTFQTPYKGIINVASGGLNASVIFPATIPLPYQLVLLPGWNTTFEVAKTINGFDLVFQTPAPADSTCIWGILSQPL